MDAAFQDTIETMERQIAGVRDSLSAMIMPDWESLERQMAGLQPVLDAAAIQIESVQDSVQLAQGLCGGPFMPTEPRAVARPVAAAVSPVRMPTRRMADRSVILPEGARWEDVRIEFLDERNTEVFYKNRMIGPYDWQDLRFVRKNTTDAKPNLQWTLLLHFSLFTAYQRGEPTVEQIANHLKNSYSTIHKRKQLLSDQLRAVFGIADDPFFEYSPIEGYRTKFILKAPHGLRDDKY